MGRSGVTFWLTGGRGLGVAADQDVGKLGLGFADGAVAPAVLPVVDEFGGSVKQLDAIHFADPSFAFQLSLKLLPSVIPRPEKVVGEGAAVFGHHLIYGNSQIVFQPEGF